MLDTATLALYLAAAVALILTPGPDTLFVLSRGAAAGPETGLRAAAGIATGVLVHTTGAVLGLAAVYRTSPAAHDLVAGAGALYLAYLGVTTVRADDLSTPDAEGGFRQGVLVNVLNPKVALFFLAFLPGFGSSTGEFALLGALYALLTALYLGAVGLLAGRVQGALDHPRAMGALQAVSGVVLLALAGRLAWALL
jgi:threonine/homoserine/homoserine lactone efflux protein